MNILLKHLLLVNFKGIKKLSIDFHQQTFIRGENATGKTTIFDAFTWLLFGKDSFDRKDFEIKPLDRSGKTLSKTENEVSAVLLVDGIEVNLRRVHREKWEKKRGALTPEFTGNETLYFYNDVPLKQGEYQAKINAIVDEKIFKLLTSTTFFNSLTWQERRRVLMDLAGTITNDDVAQKLTGDYSDVINQLATGKNIDEFKREIGARKKKIKDELAGIPTRIDEINRNIPDALDWTGIKSQVAFHQAEIKAIDESIADRSKAYEKEYQKLSAHQKQLNDLKLERTQLVGRLNSERTSKAQENTFAIDQKKRQLSHIASDVKSINERIATAKARINTLEAENIRLRERWNAENQTVLNFDEQAFHCPTCKQALPAESVEEQKHTLEQNFNDEKARKLSSISEQGQRNAKEITDQNTLIGRLEGEIRDLNNKSDLIAADLEQLQAQPAVVKLTDEELWTNSDYIKLSQEILTLEKSQPVAPSLDTKDLNESKVPHVKAIDELKAALNNKTIRDQQLARITELENEQQKLAQQLADLEQTEFKIQEFAAARISEVENRINGRFQYVSFKMFNEQINGGVEETCETVVNGVPFSNLNTASRINAGIDIINVLCEHYGVRAPIFIDNRESIISLIPTDSQVVNLVVAPGVRQLEILAENEMVEQ